MKASSVRKGPAIPSALGFLEPIARPYLCPIFDPTLCSHTIYPSKQMAVSRCVGLLFPKGIWLSKKFVHVYFWISEPVRPILSHPKQFWPLD